jgi:hypothetical protein
MISQYFVPSFFNEMFHRHFLHYFEDALFFNFPKKQNLFTEWDQKNSRDDIL